MKKFTLRPSLHKAVSCALALVLAACLPFAALASTPPAPTPSPTPAPPPATSGGSIYISAYNIVDGTTGAEILNLYPDMKCMAAFTIVDERIIDADVPQNADMAQYIHARVVADNFTPVSGGDVRYTRRAAVDGKLSYTVSFNDTSYKGVKNVFSFDLSTTTANQNSFPNAPIVTLSQTIAQCAAKDGTTASTIKPTIMVKSSSYGDQPSINAGQKFTLNVTSYNTSKKEAVSAVTTTIELPKELTLAGGSNSVLTDTVAAGGSFTNQFALMAQANAETTVANVTVRYSFYTKDSAEPVSASQIIAVPIVQPDRFSFSNMEVPPELYLGEENTITLGFVNKGKGILYNLSAEIAGNLKNPGQQQFLGNLQPGAEGTADFVVSSDTVGTVSGTITLTYEDINGNSKTQVKEYSVTISENQNNMGGGMMGPGGMMPGDMGVDGEMPLDKGGFPWWGWVLIAAGVIAVIITIVVVLKKKKAKKLAAELAEDDD